MSDKKEHIMNVAIELFAEKGYEGASIRDIATRADVNVAMVNYYFGSKDKLFEAIVEYKASYMRGKLDVIEADKNLSEIEKIDQIIEHYVDKILSNPAFHRVLHQELLMGERESIQENIIKVFIRNIKTLRNIIELGVKKKVFRKVDPELTMATLIGTINQVMLSKAMCNMLMEKDGSLDPYTNLKFRERLLKHLKEIIHAYLIK